MRKFWEFFFKAFTVAIVVMAGALIGQFIYEMVWGEDIIMYYSPSFTETLMGAAKAENLIFNWLNGFTGKACLTVTTLWLFCGALLKKIKWKWAVLFAGIWWILFGVATTAMHSLS